MRVVEVKYQLWVMPLLSVGAGITGHSQLQIAAGITSVLFCGCVLALVIGGKL